MNNQKLNIAFLGNNITFGGGATSLYLLVKSINSDKYSKFVYASTISSNEMKKNFLNYCNSVELIDVAEVKSSQTSLTSWSEYIIARDRSKKDALTLVEQLKRNHVEILHVNNSVFSHLYEWIKEYSIVKIVTHVRELILSNRINKVASIIIGNICKYSDAIITISNNESKPFEDRKNLYIIPNPFDFSLLSKRYSDLRKEKNINADTVLVGMMGRFARTKGHLLFLKALRIIVQSNLTNKPYKFVLIGISSSETWWKAIIKKILLKTSYRIEVIKFMEVNKLNNHIILIEYTKDIFDIIKSLDIVVRPSLFCDPWGRDVIESMAFGKPIVATGSSNYFIENNKSGFLTDIDENELAEKIAILIKNDELRKEFGINGFYKIKKMSDLNNYNKHIEEIYQQLGSK